jgi:photosystem II stability/assembly factor-like uncharacterized protein
MLVARHFVLAAAVVLLLAGASYAQAAPAAKGFSLSPSAIEIDPKRPNIVYASALGDDTHEGGVFKSTDAGKTWRLADRGLTNPSSPTDSTDLRVDELALDPRSPNVLYAGTGLGVFKTTDGAKTWRLASTGIEFSCGLFHRMLEGFTYQIEIDPLHTSTIYATGHNGLWKSTNAGATWKRVLRHWPNSVSIDPRRPTTVYATANRRPAPAARSRILTSVNGGGSWRPTGSHGLPDDFGAGPIVVDRRVPGIVYVGGAGLFASRNKGRTWAKLLSPGSSRGGISAIAVDPVRGSVLYAAELARGVLKSEDGGQTWSRLRLGTRNVYIIEIAPTRPQTIYAGGEGIWKSTDGGATWHRVTR